MKESFEEITRQLLLNDHEAYMKALEDNGLLEKFWKYDVVVFVRNLMDNVLYQDAYNAFSEKMDKTLRLVSRIRDELKKDADKLKDQSAQLLDIAKRILSKLSESIRRKETCYRCYF